MEEWGDYCFSELSVSAFEKNKLLRIEIRAFSIIDCSPLETICRLQQQKHHIPPAPKQMLSTLLKTSMLS